MRRSRMPVESLVLMVTLHVGLGAWMVSFRILLHREQSAARALRARIESVLSDAERDLVELKGFAYSHGRMLMEEVGGSKTLLKATIERCERHRCAAQGP